MSRYTYTIFDGMDTGGDVAWPAHQGVEIDASSHEEAVERTLEILTEEAAGLSVADGYTVGQVLYARVWDDAGTFVGAATYTLTVDDIDPPKSGVEDWEDIASYVTTFPADDGEGAADVAVQVGTAYGAWFVRTSDDAGGSDDAPDTAYATREEAEAAAEEFAAANNEADDGESAADYLERCRGDRIGEPDSEGEWAVYWETVGDDARVVERYETQDQAAAAADRANDQLHERHRGQLLCGYSVRRLVDGEWIEVVS